MILRLARLALGVLSLGGVVHAQRIPIPHHQDRAPGPAVSPREALENFVLPDGFRLELVASEPDIVNPIKMSFDGRGRIWIVESLEYPRRTAGEGRDRVKVLEDTDGDGAIDSFQVFADGLNIPCGIAVGYGGVFVTNSPDILFLQDTDGDGRADRREVVVTGFGRRDTHELPNTLAWGPDGWLYGLNGVFNPARIEQKGKQYNFTCALWRYHPRTRDFELFAEGTSNPWGLGFDRNGAAFVEACVIDHLFHLTESGYYHRQGGAYPPFTWKIESIVKHRNYKAAYCGLDFYDAEVYPAEYRHLVYFGNIHGNCVNADRLERRGSTYFARRGPIILNTDDPWFMPVDVRLGPDGCLYVLDWYDRYHCYQDARRDPEGIDRLRGRLWRVVYGDVEQPRGFDLDGESSERLVARLASSNRWWRDTARVTLAARRDPVSYGRLRKLVLDASAERHVRMQALWTLVGCDDPGVKPDAVDEPFHHRVLALEDGGLRAWGVRAAGNARRVSDALRARVRELAVDLNPDVRLQVAIVARKLHASDEALDILLAVLERSTDDPLISKIVWRNMEPLLEEHGGKLVAWLEERVVSRLPAVESLLGRIVDRLLARKRHRIAPLVGLVGLLLRDPEVYPEAVAQCLDVVSRSLVNGELDSSSLASLRPHLAAAIGAIMKKGVGDRAYMPAVTIASSWREPGALEACRAVLGDASLDPALRGRALRALVFTRDASLLVFAAEILRGPGKTPRALVVELLSALGELEDAGVAALVLRGFGKLPAALRPRAIDLLSQRTTWARMFLREVEAGRIDSRQLNLAQARRLLALDDEEVTRRVRATWGTIRAARNPGREDVIVRMRKVLDGGPGDPWAGKAVFEKTCSQCHVLFGKGNTVGPDITVNGRETLDLLLSNLLDPNLVIGKGYFASTVITSTGRTLTGLLVEESPQRVVLRVAGGKDEVVPRRQVLRLNESPVSLMPEDLEKTITEKEFVDLITYLRHDEQPPEPVGTRIIGSGADTGLIVSQTYGKLRVAARFPGALSAVDLLTYQHSNDWRPFIHPLRAPCGGPVLTALRSVERELFHGIFTGHPDIGGIDFWKGKGWIRSRGLESVVQTAHSVEFVSVSNWMTRRRGGVRVLVERQKVTIWQPELEDRYSIDVEWSVTPDSDITVGQHQIGGLALSTARHSERRLERAAGGMRRPWQDISGRFGGDDADDGDDNANRVAGVAIFDHPDNPGFPTRWSSGRQGLIGPAISAAGPRRLEAGKTLTLRYRLVVHDGHGNREMLDEEFRRWVDGAALAR